VRWTAYGNYTTEKCGAQKYQESGGRSAEEKDNCAPSEVGADCARKKGLEDGQAEA